MLPCFLSSYVMLLVLVVVSGADLLLMLVSGAYVSVWLCPVLSTSSGIEKWKLQNSCDKRTCTESTDVCETETRHPMLVAFVVRCYITPSSFFFPDLFFFSF